MYSVKSLLTRAGTGNISSIVMRSQPTVASRRSFATIHKSHSMSNKNSDKWNKKGKPTTDSKLDSQKVEWSTLPKNEYFDQNQSFHRKKLEYSKKIRGQKSHQLRRIWKTPPETAHLRKAVNGCTNGSEILAILKSEPDSDSSVYSKSLQKCLQLKATHLIPKIVDLMQSSNVSPQIFFYNILFNTLINARHCGPKIRMESILHYFKTMLNDSNVRPTPITLSTLLRAVRLIGKADLEMTDYILQTLTRDNITGLDNYAATELIGIYAKHNEIEKCEIVFKDILKPDITNYGSLLNAYAEIGDIKACHSLIRNEILADESLSANLENNTIIFGSLMKCFMKANRPQRVIKTFADMISEPQRTPIEHHWNMLATAYLSLIEKECQRRNDLLNLQSSENESEIVDIGSTINSYLQTLSTDIPKQRRERYKLPKSTHVLSMITLKCALLAYDSDFSKVVPIYESLLNLGGLGIWNRDRIHDGTAVDHYNRVWKLDFHAFSAINTRFLLKYAFHYSRKDITDAMAAHPYFYIICGKGNHRDNTTALGCSPTGQLIIEELQSWKPAIECSVNPHNFGELCATPVSISEYFECNQSNHAIKASKSVEL